MRLSRYIFPLMLALLFLNGCGSRALLNKKERSAEGDTRKLITGLLSAPPVTELTASYSSTVNGARISGQIRMRRDHSIQISANLLGLMEVGRVEFLPDRIIIVDRVHNVYSTCYYADVPYRNEIGLDFYMVEALFWNRLFSPGAEDPVKAALKLKAGTPLSNGNVPITETEYGYQFVTDGVSRLVSSVKSGKSYKVAVEYSDFRDIKPGYMFPNTLLLNLTFPDITIPLNIRMSQISVEKKNWPDMTQISSRMKKVTLDAFFDGLGL